MYMIDLRMLMVMNVHCPFLNKINTKEANFDLVLLVSELEAAHLSLLDDKTLRLGLNILE